MDQLLRPAQSLKPIRIEVSPPAQLINRQHSRAVPPAPSQARPTLQQPHRESTQRDHRDIIGVCHVRHVQFLCASVTWSGVLKAKRRGLDMIRPSKRIVASATLRLYACPVADRAHRRREASQSFGAPSRHAAAALLEVLLVQHVLLSQQRLHDVRARLA